MNGVAHATFSGGGIVLRAHEPCDRELLVEHVAERVRRNGVVRVATRIDRIERPEGAAYGQ